MIWLINSSIFNSCEYPYWAKRDCNSMYNCGVIGFNNQELKDEYFATYNAMVKEYNKTRLNVDGTTPDIIIEQQFLKDLVEYKGYKTKFVLPYCDCFDSLCEEANHAHFQHVIGHAKEPNLDKILLIIKKHNAEIYDKLIEFKKQMYDNN